ncbi:MAG: RidA family protein [Betaproteobacteria bacterium]|nr:RidA family protein [Betaproteobacteria bacterium]
MPATGALIFLSGAERMIATEQLPAPRGKFSRVRAISIGTTRMLFLSGMTSGGEAPYDIRKQSEIIFRRMEHLLAEHGASLADLVKITAFLTDIREYDGYNEVRNRIFVNFSAPSASTSVGITLLSPEMRIEIEGIAVIQEQP